MDDLTIDDLDPFVEEQLRLRATVTAVPGKRKFDRS
jgi:hypothetical protein